MQINNPRMFFLAAILGLFFVGVYSSYIVVSEQDQYVITELGKPIRTISKAGLHFKLPWQKAVVFEKRILEWDGEPQNITTREKKTISINTTARWKIVDTFKFIERVRTETKARALIGEIIESATRDVVSLHRLVEGVRSSNLILERWKSHVEENQTEDSEQSEQDDARIAIEPVSYGRLKLQEMILEKSKPQIQDFGIELVDFRIKRLNYEKSVQSKVFESMISERNRMAEKHRSIGRGKKAEIEGEMEQKLKEIESEAYRKSQEIMGKADAEAAEIYAKAYGKDPEFYRFLKTLETYQSTFSDRFHLFLSSEGAFLKFLNEEPSVR